MQLSLSLIALLLSAAEAFPLLPNDTPGAATSGHTFTFPVERKRSMVMKSPARMMADTLTKYGKHNAEALNSAKLLAASGKGTVSANPTRFDQEYLAPIVVGGQMLQLDVDTGSSDLWVYSDQLSPEQQTNHSIYNPNRSTVARPLEGSYWEVQYGDGSYASGDVYSDCVAAGDTIVEHQGVELASYLSSSFLTDPSDGILGLGFDSINSAVPAQKTFISNAIEQGLARPVFTANLYPFQSGTYDFGFIDPSKYSGSIAYSQVDSSMGYWMINMTGWSFGSSSTVEMSSPSYFQPTVVDTGTSIVYLNVNIVRGYWATVPSATFSFQDGGYIYPCGTPLPDLTIQFHNFNATIPGHLNEYAPTEEDPSWCFGGLQSQETLDFNILGDVFLKTIFAVFDMGDEPRIGFAQKPDSS